MTIKVTKEKKPEYSKRLVSDIRSLLWVVTVGGLLLAAYCIHKATPAPSPGCLPWWAYPGQRTALCARSI